MLSLLNQEKRQEQEDTLAALDKELDSETIELDKALSQWKEADAHMEEFGKQLDIAFNLAGCSNSGIVALLGTKPVDKAFQFMEECISNTHFVL